MPRKPRATIEPLSTAAADSAATAPKKRATSKKPTASTRTASPTKTTAAQVKKTAPSSALSSETPKRAAKPEPRKKSAPAAKSNGARAASRGAKTVVFDSNSYHGDIARLAYHFWEQRGRAEGSPEEDWLRAEQELRQTLLAESA